MKNISVFQIVIFAICILVALVGVAVFAGFGGTNKTGTPTATVWGTLPTPAMVQLVSDLNLNQIKINVNYIQKDPVTFQSELVNALSEGTGPDIALLDDSMLYANRNKIQPLPFTVYPERNYLDTFVNASSLFVDRAGILAVPFQIDPLVMYWNKNIFSAAGLSQPPKTWVELQTMAPSVIKKTDSSAITQAFVPFGQYSNVTNAKQIIASMLFQLNNPISSINPNTNAVFSVIDQAANKDVPQKPLETVMNFYTAFANPSNKVYTWNLSMPPSREAFLAGNLAIYFGPASELKELQDKNPNLNFDVAEVPQDTNTLPAVYGKITGLAIMKTTRNYNSAVSIVSALSSKLSIDEWSKAVDLPPVRKDSLAVATEDAFATVFNRAAIKSKAWFDPNPSESDAAFSDMVESITTGRKAPSGAISDLAGILGRQYLK